MKRLLITLALATSLLSIATPAFADGPTYSDGAAWRGDITYGDGYYTPAFEWTSPPVTWLNANNELTTKDQATWSVDVNGSVGYHGDPAKR